MDIYFFIKGIIVGISVSAPLGPIGVLCIQRTMNKGLASGVASSFGAAGADTFYAIVAGFGITLISNFLNTQQEILRIVGSIFLIYLGYKIFSTNPAKQLRKQQKKKRNLLGDFVSMFFITLSNPLTVIVFGAIFAGLGFLDENSDFNTTLLLTFGVFCGALIWWAILLGIVNIFRNKIRLRSLLYINKITGAFIILLGIAAILSVFFINEI